MRSAGLKLIVALVLIGGGVSLGRAIFHRLQTPVVARKLKTEPRAAPVEVAPIEHGLMQRRRTLSGSLEARAAFVVAPKIRGRIVRFTVDLADTIQRGQIVAWLDDDEHVQMVAQAEAELLVAQATLAAARSALDIAARTLRRVESLRQRGMVSESQFDVAQADHLAKDAQLKVAKAQVARARAVLKGQQIQLGYTKVIANWHDGATHRVVAERFVDAGETVAANDSLLSIVELHPITGVIFVAERDYAHLHRGQSISLTTDAYGGERFQGRIDRIAPVFREVTRQARVELVIDNPAQRLKPGMFIRATVVLERVGEATIIPQQALTIRNDRHGVFVVNADGRSVVWREVTVGIQEGNRVQVAGEGLVGRVVTLGQQLIDDGARITIPDDTRTPSVPQAEVTNP